MNIYIKSDDRYHNEFYQLYRVEHELKKYNIYFTNDYNSCDLYIALTKYISIEELDKIDLPICLFSHQDGSSIFWRDKLNHNNVKRCIVKFITKTIEKQNTGCVRYHSFLIDNNNQHKISSLTQESFNKLRLGPNFAHYKCMNSWLKSQPSYKRFGTFFVGHTQYTDNPLDTSITKHRNLFKNIIHSSSYCKHLKYMSQKKYNEEICKSCCIVSPWGYGDMCYRDFETMYGSSILIKPYCDYIDMYPSNVFIDGETYLSCKIDGSDILEKIELCCNNYNQYENIVQRNREILISSWNTIDIAKLYALTFLECI